MQWSEIFNFEEIKTKTKAGVLKSFDFKGKTGRKEFIQFAIGITTTLLGINWIASITDINFFEFVAGIITIIGIIPCISIVARRFNDRGKNAVGYITIFLLSIVGMIVFSHYQNHLQREVEIVLEQVLYIAFFLSIAFALRFCIR